MTLCQEYEACVGALSDFRKAHMRIAVSYLSRTATGTGSSSFKEMLAAFATDTRALLKREGLGERTGGGGGALEKHEQEQKRKRALNNAVTNEVESTRISIRTFRKEESE